ncbi:MAG: hypothetical protein AAGK21_12105 [Bacteroidota bacterium]
MGFFSNIARNLTGNWADVTLDVPDGARGESLHLLVHVNVRDEDIDVSRVVVKVRCQEHVRVPNARTTTSAPGADGTRRQSTGDATTSATLFDREVIASPATTLEAGSSHTFDAIVELPMHVPPTIEGRNARFEWEAYASLDMKGNDPDSGWREFRVS